MSWPGMKYTLIALLQRGNDTNSRRADGNLILSYMGFDTQVSAGHRKKSAADQ